MTTLEHPPVASEPPPEAPRPSTEGGTGSLVVLLAAIAGLAALSIGFGFWKPLLVIVALFVMIMLHEAGHFVMARRGGMKATEFFVGFGPKLWSFRRGETEYGFKLLPLGGYVKILGMTSLEPVAPEDEPRSYRQQPFWQRFGVAVAGSTMHMVMAFALLLGLNAVVGNPLHGTNTPVISEISRLDDGRSPAVEAGLQVGDELLSMDGGPVVSWDDVRSYVGKRPSQPITFVVERKGQRVTAVVTPVDRATVTPIGADGKPDPSLPRPAPGTAGYIGISPTEHDPTYGPIAAVGRSAADLGTLVKGTVGAMGRLFSFQGVRSYTHQLSGAPVSTADKGNRFLSPVGVYRVAGQAADQGLSSVLVLLVLINVFVGLFNMIPLLPFDGGHTVIAIYEGIRGRLTRTRYRIDAAKVMPLAYATFAVLLLIGLSSLYLDLVRPA